MDGHVNNRDRNGIRTIPFRMKVGVRFSLDHIVQKNLRMRFLPILRCSGRNRVAGWSERNRHGAESLLRQRH